MYLSVNNRSDVIGKPGARGCDVIGTSERNRSVVIRRLGFELYMQLFVGASLLTLW